MTYQDLGFRSYQEYLASPHWQELVAKRRRNPDRQCRICGARTRLVLHHRTYVNLGHEKPGDLVDLCEDCNREVHFNGRIRTPLFYEYLWPREQMLYKRRRSFKYRIMMVHPSDLINPLVWWLMDH